MACEGKPLYGSQAVMNAVEIAALFNPCGLAAKGLAVQGLYNTTVYANENGLSLKTFLLTGYNLAGLFGACFTGDMLVRCEGGKKRADAIREGDRLWSRDEHDPDGPLVLKRVLRVFERTANIWHVRVGGQVLRTTVEHPFWVENRQSWLQVGELRVADVLRTDSGEFVAVEEIEDSGKWERVYNWEIEDYHTYFVSASEDAANIWAHNNNCSEVLDESLGARGDITSAYALTAAEALELAEAWLGPGARELGRPGSGVFRSADGLFQFRMDPNSLLGRHRPNVPHVHFEQLDALGNVLSNNHVPLI